MATARATAFANFAKGYQEALQDVARAHAAGGAEAVAEWLANNLTAASKAELSAETSSAGD